MNNLRHITGTFCSFEKARCGEVFLHRSYHIVAAMRLATIFTAAMRMAALLTAAIRLVAILTAAMRLAAYITVAMRLLSCVTAPEFGKILI